MRALAAIVGLLCLAAAAGFMSDASAQEGKRRVSISIDKFATDVEKTAWMAYGISLAAWLEKSGIGASVPEGPFILPYEGEFVARQGQLKIWRDLNKKGRYSLKYMDDIQKVETSGFLREYLWEHHAHPSWGTPPADLRVDDFLRWQAENLAEHVPQTGARIVFGPPK